MEIISLLKADEIFILQKKILKILKNSSTPDVNKGNVRVFINEAKNDWGRVAWSIYRLTPE